MSPLARVLVTLFLGGFGVHKFIDGQIGKGILYLFTGGLFGIGWIVDICKAVANLLNDQSPSPSASASSVTDNSRNGFCEFDHRPLDADETDLLSGEYLVQLLKYIHSK